MLQGVEREVPSFPGPEELWNLTFAKQNSWRDRFAAVPYPDNSAPADPASGKAPAPVLVLHMERGRILNPQDLAHAPGWAKPIAAAAMKMGLKS